MFESTKKQPCEEQQSGFLELTGELRNMIYCYAVLEDEPISTEIRSATAYSMQDRSKGKNYRVMVHPQPPLAMVSHAIRKEVLSIYYSENVFLLRQQPERAVTFQTWARALQPHLQHLRCVKLRKSLILDVMGRLLVKIEATLGLDGNIALAIVGEPQDICRCWFDEVVCRMRKGRKGDCAWR